MATAGEPVSKSHLPPPPATQATPSVTLQVRLQWNDQGRPIVDITGDDAGKVSDVIGATLRAQKVDHTDEAEGSSEAANDSEENPRPVIEVGSAEPAANEPVPEVDHGGALIELVRLIRSECGLTERTAEEAAKAAERVFEEVNTVSAAKLNEADRQSLWSLRGRLIGAVGSGRGNVYGETWTLDHRAYQIIQERESVPGDSDASSKPGDEFRCGMRDCTYKGYNQRGLNQHLRQIHPGSAELVVEVHAREAEATTTKTRKGEQIPQSVLDRLGPFSVLEVGKTYHKPEDWERCPVCGYLSSHLGVAYHMGMAHEDDLRALLRKKPELVTDEGGETGTEPPDFREAPARPGRTGRPKVGSWTQLGLAFEMHLREMSFRDIAQTLAKADPSLKSTNNQLPGRWIRSVYQELRLNPPGHSTGSALGPAKKAIEQLGAKEREALYQAAFQRRSDGGEQRPVPLHPVKPKSMEPPSIPYLAMLLQPMPNDYEDEWSISREELEEDRKDRFPFCRESDPEKLTDIGMVPSSGAIQYDDAMTNGIRPVVAIEWARTLGWILSNGKTATEKDDNRWLKMIESPKEENRILRGLWSLWHTSLPKHRCNRLPPSPRSPSRSST